MAERRRRHSAGVLRFRVIPTRLSSENREFKKFLETRDVSLEPNFRIFDLCLDLHNRGF